MTDLDRDHDLGDDLEAEPAPPPDDDQEPDEPTGPTVPPFEEIAAALGLPTDARAVVITPTTAVAIAADYPEPHTIPEPEEATDGD